MCTLTHLLWGLQGSPCQRLIWRPVLLQRRGSVQPNSSRYKKSTEQHQRDDVDLALWLAANRPARPDSWASVGGEEVQEPLLGPGSLQRPRGHFEPCIGGQQQKDQAPERQGWDANAQSCEEGQRAQAAAVGPACQGWGVNALSCGGGQHAQAAAVGPEPIHRHEVVDLSSDAWAGSLDFLPDVPGGLESVDQLATHISLELTTPATNSLSTFTPHIPPSSPSRTRDIPGFFGPAGHPQLPVADHLCN